MCSDLMLLTASEIFIVLAYSALGFFRYMPAYSIILSVIETFTRIEPLLRHTQAYSAPCVALAYSQRCHILSPSKFKTGDCETLWNVDQIYSEPYHRALFSHIQPYSEPRVTLAYAETWHTQNPGIFKTLP